MENNNKTRKIMGPYDSKKQALRANGLVSMNGTFAGGILKSIDGEVYMTMNVRAYYSDEGDGGWFAEVDVRPTTAGERRQYQIGCLKRELKHCQMAFSADPTDPVAIQNRENITRLELEIAALEAEAANA